MSIWTTISERIGKKDSSEDQSGFDSAITRYQQRSGPTENYIHAWYMHSILGQSLFCLNKVWRWSASGCDEVLRKAGLLSSFSVLVFYLPLVNTPESLWSSGPDSFLASQQRWHLGYYGRYWYMWASAMFYWEMTLYYKAGRQHFLVEDCVDRGLDKPQWTTTTDDMEPQTTSDCGNFKQVAFHASSLWDNDFWTKSKNFIFICRELWTTEQRFRSSPP